MTQVNNGQPTHFAYILQDKEKHWIGVRRQWAQSAVTFEFDDGVFWDAEVVVHFVPVILAEDATTGMFQPKPNKAKA